MSLTLLVGRGAEALADAILCPLNQPRASSPALGPWALSALPPMNTACSHLDSFLFLFFLKDRERKVARSVCLNGEVGIAKPQDLHPGSPGP